MDPIDNGPFAPNKCPICSWTNMKGAEACEGTMPEVGGPCVWTPPEQEDDYCERILPNWLVLGGDLEVLNGFRVEY
ncbi:hypothetical protein FIE12Z_12919 [Fusarium flagelliforme]|uniref:Uncharacterized protein n=1 Tax=Fusarium flagelliforme TaxID=2675880 RepID=A0A395M4Q2_9HYPO|nr:hypothetical protein FIE12Z_12919 [Fusarium flagelliforme]